MTKWTWPVPRLCSGCIAPQCWKGTFTVATATMHASHKTTRQNGPECIACLRHMGNFTSHSNAYATKILLKVHKCSWGAWAKSHETTGTFCHCLMLDWVCLSDRILMIKKGIITGYKEEIPKAWLAEMDKPDRALPHFSFSKEYSIFTRISHYLWHQGQMSHRKKHSLAANTFPWQMHIETQGRKCLMSI